MARKRDTISERHGLCTVCNRYGRLHPAKIPPQGAGFRGFHRMYQLQTPTAPMERTDSIHRLHYPRNGSFLFFFQSDDKKEIRYLLKKDNFDKPICMDQSDRLNELNHFPADGRFQTFLLDKDNKVVVIGNPIHNPNIRELYLKEITGKQPASQIQTTVKVEEASIQLGTIQMGESKEAVFRLTNTGNNPLVILDAATTCGCARPSFDKHPAKPGEILQVRVIMTPKDKGVFDETISVKCNTNQLIKLNIRGMAQ